MRVVIAISQSKLYSQPFHLPITLTATAKLQDQPSDPGNCSSQRRLNFGVGEKWKGNESENLISDAKSLDET